MTNERRLGRTKRISHVPVQRVRRDFQIYLNHRGLEEPVVSFCRQYGMVDEQTGGPRRAEAVRLLLYIALLRSYPNRVQATVEAAVRANKPMLIGGMFRRLQMMFATAEPTAAPCGVGTGNSKVHIILDNWLYQAMQSLEMGYRAGDGVVDDIRMACDGIRAALQDPELHRITQLYVARISPLRETVQKLEQYNRTMLVHGLGQERPIEELLRRTG